MAVGSLIESRGERKMKRVGEGQKTIEWGGGGGWKTIEMRRRRRENNKIVEKGIKKEKIEEGNVV